MPFDGRPTQNKSQQILLDVRDRLSKADAWCQGSNNGPNGSHCVLGWGYALHTERDFCPVAVMLHICARQEGWTGLIELNDHPSQTQAGVVAFLDRAIGEIQ